MYSWEIDEILKNNNFNIDSGTYINICNTSPQINYIKYEPYGQYFEMWDCNGKYWKFKVYKKEKSIN